MLKKISTALSILLVFTFITVGILYKVRSLPDYQKWPIKNESKLFGDLFTEYKYDDSFNWVAERRTTKEARPEEITWHFTIKGENGLIVYFTENTYKPFLGLYFPTKIYELKYTGKCGDWAGRKANCFQWSRYVSLLGLYFTEQSGVEYHLLQ